MRSRAERRGDELMRVSNSDVVDLLRRWIRGEVSAVVLDETWHEVFAGDVTYRLSSGDTIVLFNDCNDLDYVDSVTMADGRRGVFDDWADQFDGTDAQSPLGMLTDEEYAALARLAETCQPSGPSRP